MFAPLQDRFDEHSSVSVNDGRDVICPVACGQCCEDLAEGYTCLCITPWGCALPRDQRPAVCRDYMCARGKEALAAL